MKVAVSAREPLLEAEVDPRFGRAAWLVVYDLDTGDFQSIDNSPNVNAAQGAGIKTAETVVSAGCEAVISGHLGPKAFNVLQRAGVKGYGKVAGTIKENLHQLQTGNLEELNAADAAQYK